MGKVIAILSGKGGVGKTTVCLNLAAALNERMKDVVVVDMNLTSPNVSIHLGSPILPFTINNLLDGTCDLYQSIYIHKTGIKVIPASIALNDAFKSKESMNNVSNIVNHLKSFYDYVLIDCAPGFNEDLIYSIKVSDSVIVITNNELPAVTEALKSIKLAKSLGKKVERVVINKYVDNKDLNIDTVDKILGHKTIHLDYDDNFRSSLAEREIAYYSSQSIKEQFNALARALIDKSYNTMTKQTFKSFVQRLHSMFS